MENNDITSKCRFTGKTRFPDIGTAKNALISLKANSQSRYRHGSIVKHRKKKTSQKRVYWCKQCKGFHLTSMETFFNKGYRENSRKIATRDFYRDFDIANWKLDSLPFPKTNTEL